jgi:hypothetical protein
MTTYGSLRIRTDTALKARHAIKHAQALGLKVTSIKAYGWFTDQEGYPVGSLYGHSVINLGHTRVTVAEIRTDKGIETLSLKPDKPVSISGKNLVQGGYIEITAEAAMG